MHILFLTHYFPPEVNAPASRTFEHARRWVTDGAEVTVVTNHPNHPRGELYPGYRNRLLSRETMDGIDVRRVWTFLAPNAGFLKRTLNYLFFMVAALFGAEGARQPGMVVATSPQFFCAVAGYLVSRLRRCPFVMEVRDLWPDSIVTVGAMRKSLAITLLEQLELFLYRKAEHIIAVTDAFKANMVERGVPAEKISVVKNGVDLEFFEPRSRPQELEARLGLKGRFVASYIGTIGMAHAVTGIVEAAALLREDDSIRFLVVGEGAEKAKVQRRVEELGLKNVLVLPAVGKEEVRDYYALSDLSLVTLARKDLFKTVIPSKIFELMGMCRPILSTVDGETRKILESAGSGDYVEAENPEAMAAAIRRLKADAGRLEEMSGAGREFVREHFSRDVLAGRCLDVLESVDSPGN